MRSATTIMSPAKIRSKTGGETRCVSCEPASAPITPVMLKRIAAFPCTCPLRAPRMLPTSVVPPTTARDIPTACAGGTFAA